MITGNRIHTHGPVEVGNGVCAAGHPLTAEAAIRVMKQGGNAVDGLAAACFTAFVTEQSSCGIGGYVHISVWLAEANRFLTFDAYSRAPLAATADMFEADTAQPPTYYGHPPTKGDRSEHGPLAPAVPGAVAGVCDMHEMLGKLPLATVMEPAIEAAKAGPAFTFYDVLGIAQVLPNLTGDARAVLLPNGAPPRIPGSEPDGDRMDGRALARTLEAVAAKGKAGFYRGRVARAIERYMAAIGGIVTAKDLAAYRTRALLETPARYRGHDYISCFDQVAYEALNILDHYDLRTLGPDSYEYRHLVAEALALAFADSITHYGDPDFVPSPVNGLASPAFAARRKKLIRLRKAMERPVAAGDPWPFEPMIPVLLVKPPGPSLGRRPGTSMAAIADRHGNLASTCMSIGNIYGALVYIPEAGIFLNNAMRNYDPRPGFPSSIAPGKMPIFAAPAIVAARRGKPAFAASGSGGYRIETGVLHTMMNLIDHRMPLQRAVDHPRVHCQGEETYADPRIPARVRDRLARAGHDLRLVEEQPNSMTFARVCAVSANPHRKTLAAAAGPSWTTAIAGY